ncbi:hypothetical protein [Synechococcus sp. BIOS-U3-1]|uniref:hypothetical protein n=1 Tax=Synechococcus sp. BIOS-U3-1 TaxID=1400865 RepID=UPI0021028920|nr:hypothetical protein [Synechococcus sp. BIOS-U3-1]
MAAPNLAQPLAESDLTSFPGLIRAAKVKGAAIAARHYVMFRGSYLLCCRVFELCRLRREAIEPLDGGGKVRRLGKGSNPATYVLVLRRWSCSSRWAAGSLGTGFSQISLRSCRSW